MIESALIRCSFTPILFVCAVGLVQADEGTDFFEKHSPSAGRAMLRLPQCQTEVAARRLLRGQQRRAAEGRQVRSPGRSYPGKPEESLLIKAIRGYAQGSEDAAGQALAPEQIQAFVDWVKMGAPDPRTGGATDRGEVGLRLGSREETLGLSAGEGSATAGSEGPGVEPHGYRSVHQEPSSTRKVFVPWRRPAGGSYSGASRTISRACRRRRRRWRTSLLINRRKRSRRWSIGCWHLRAMANTGGVTGWM